MGQGSVVHSIEKSAESSMQNVFLPKIVKSISLVNLEKWFNVFNDLFRGCIVMLKKVLHQKYFLQ